MNAVARPLTAPGEGGISVVALEGNEAEVVLDRLFRSKVKPGAGGIAHGWIEEEGRRLDEALVWPVAGGFEIGLHGGSAALAAVLRAMRRAGVRVVRDVPETGGEFERDAALLLPAAATLPAAMFLAAAAGGALTRAVAKADAEGLRALVAASPRGLALATPRVVVLAGLPNAGKSTLLNALAGRDRALVHEAPGTTRDPVEVLADVLGYPVRLIDTAGFAGAQSGIDAEAERRSREAAAQASLVIWIEDPAARGEPSVKAGLRLSGKADLGGRIPGALPVSGVTGEGLDALRQSIATALGLPFPAHAAPAPFLPYHVEAIHRRLS